MPVKDGYQASEEILAMNKDQKIIALTSFSNKDVRERSKRIGMLDVYNKPFKAEKV